MRLIRLLKRDLAKECSEWVKDNLISEDQAVSICDRYGINYRDAAKKTYGYFVLIVLGFLFIGLAVITLLSANWDDIPRAVRMSGLLLLTISTNLFALKKYYDGKSLEAIGLFFLGSLFYGASIMLIAQIYHISEHYPNGVLWWAIGVLPFAVLLESSLMYALTYALAFIWFFVENNLHYYPALFPVFLAALAWHVFKVKQSNVLFLGFILGIIIWSEYTLAWLVGNSRPIFSAEHFIFTIGLFIVFHGFSKWLMSLTDKKMVDYGVILSLWTLRFAIILLLFFSFEALWEELIDAAWKNVGLTFTMAMLLSVAGGWLSYIGNRQFYSTLIFVLFYIFGTYLVVQIEDDSYAFYFQIATNIVLIMTGIWLIIRGVKDNITHYFFLGVLSILLTAFLRYVDIIGDYVSAAILFIIFAVILLSVAYFWKAHQKSQQEP